MSLKYEPASVTPDVAPAAASSLEEEVEEEEGAGGAGRAENTARPSARSCPEPVGSLRQSQGCTPAVEEQRAGRRVSQPPQAYRPSAYEQRGARGEGTPRLTTMSRGSQPSHFGSHLVAPSKEAGGKRAPSAEEDIASQEETTPPSGRRARVAEQEGEGREQTKSNLALEFEPNQTWRSGEANNLRDYNCPGTLPEKQAEPRAERRVSQPRQVHRPSAYQQRGAAGGGGGGTVGAAGGGGGTVAAGKPEEEVASQEEMASPSGKRRRATVVEQEEVQAEASPGPVCATRHQCSAGPSLLSSAGSMHEDVAPAAGARGVGRGGAAGTGPGGARGAQEGGEARSRLTTMSRGSRPSHSGSHLVAPSKEVKQLGSIFPAFTHYAAPHAGRRAAPPPQKFKPSSGRHQFLRRQQPPQKFKPS